MPDSSSLVPATGEEESGSDRVLARQRLDQNSLLEPRIYHIYRVMFLSLLGFQVMEAGFDRVIDNFWGKNNELGSEAVGLGEVAKSHAEAQVQAPNSSSLPSIE